MMRRDPQKHYQLSEEIGKGTFATVYRGISLETKQKVAIKIIELANITDENLAQALNEIRILSSVESPHVVQYIESFVLRNHSQLWVVMELLEGGDLSKLIEQNERLNKLPNEKQVWIFLIQALIGLKTLHSLKIIHRDLKPSNLYLTSDRQNLKIGDMNVSTLPNQGPANLIIGTPPYVAPEIWRQQPYTTNSDIFSLGCSIYEYATLLLPFNGKTIDDLKTQILTHKAAKLPSKFSSDLQTILTKCFTKIPELRPSAHALLEDPIVKEKIASFKIDISSINQQKLAPEIKIPKKRYFEKLQLPRRQASPVVNTGALSKMIESMFFKTTHGTLSKSPAHTTKKNPNPPITAGNLSIRNQDKSSKTLSRVNGISIRSNILMGKVKGYQPQTSTSYKHPVASSLVKKPVTSAKSQTKKADDMPILKKLTADTGIPNSDRSFISEIHVTKGKGNQAPSHAKLKLEKAPTEKSKQPQRRHAPVSKSPSTLSTRSKVTPNKK